MMTLKFTGLFLSLFLIATNASAVEKLPNHLINFTDKAALSFLKSDAKTNTLKLLSHFTTQKTTTYCGVASAVMILNSSNLKPSPDTEHQPYSYFNQEDFFTDTVNKIVVAEDVKKTGMTLLQLSNAIQSFGLTTKAYPAKELNLPEFRKILKSAIADEKFIIVNFLRSELAQAGGGHHSPLAAYDKKTDRFLMLDVARYKYPAYWVKTQDLWKAANTIDGNQSRGFIVVSE
jgi:hypothetical protein